MPTIGQTLRAARERRQETLAQAAAATRIGARHLEALEQDNFAAIPAVTYVRGFIRMYATHLGLDAAPLLREQAQLSPAAARPSLVPHDDRPRPKPLPPPEPRSAPAAAGAPVVSPAAPPAAPPAASAAPPAASPAPIVAPPSPTVPAAGPPHGGMSRLYRQLARPDRQADQMELLPGSSVPVAEARPEAPAATPAPATPSPAAPTPVGAVPVAPTPAPAPAEVSAPASLPPPSAPPAPARTESPAAPKAAPPVPAPMRPMIPPAAKPAGPADARPAAPPRTAPGPGSSILKKPARPPGEPAATPAAWAAWRAPVAVAAVMLLLTGLLLWRTHGKPEKPATAEKEAAAKVEVAARPRHTELGLIREPAEPYVEVAIPKS